MPPYLAHGYGAPGAAVAALVAIVAHGEDVPLRNREGVALRKLRAELPGREFVVRKSIVPGQEVGGAEGRKIVPRARAEGYAFCVGAVVYGSAVDVERASLCLDSVASDSDDAFDEVPGFLVKRNEDKHVASRGFVGVEESDVRPRNVDAVDKLVDKDAISDEQGVFHGAGGDLERLDDEGTHESEDKYDGDHDGAKVFPCHGAFESTPSGG